ncbi:XRE family transcriptional regulator [Streptomyces sp. NPDC049555]|uniref:helix-turn-helix domain-containing protein n=1 Tax=Streptomyces sp. NPDC049555 TaxID=3154930 RepID=UPI0034427251
MANDDAAVLAAVGPRLRALRTRRGITLTALAATTGISLSTLSRLESGHRRPTLELLLPLARAYQVPLDDLVGAPPVGDPRVRLKPHARSGATIVPLTPYAGGGGLQAFKMLIPTTRSDPDLRSHAGSEWLYVLSGRLRLVLGEREVLLGEREAAQFDTSTPHWFGSTGAVPAEVLSVHVSPAAG